MPTPAWITRSDEEVVVENRRLKLGEIEMMNPLDVLRYYRGVYECPTLGGQRFGPLVGYAGSYATQQGPKHYVGDVYYNLARADEDTRITEVWARDIWRRVDIKALVNPQLLLGMPMGGLNFTSALGRVGDCLIAFAEKKVTAVATKDSREQSELVMNRYEIPSGRRVALVEDVTNNFSTTAKAVSLVTLAGSEVVAIFTMMNRSEREFYAQGELGIPIYSVMDIPTAQYRQDDEFVRSDIEKGNVIWKPKDRWDELMAVMKRHTGSRV